MNHAEMIVERREGHMPSVRGELRAMLRLALPLIVVQVGMMMMGVVDTVMVGHVSANALASVALGNTYFFAAAVFSMGVLMALDPVVAQAVGAGDDTAIARGMQRGLLLAALLSVLASLFLLTAQPVLTALRQPAVIVPVAADYAFSTIPGVFPFLAFIVLRQSLQAMGRITAIVVTIVIANLANVLLNWMLIFGELGAPALGAVGAGWATSISRALMALLLVVLAWKPLRPYLRPFRPDVLSLTPLVRMIRLGAPIGIHFAFEYGVFGTVALLMGLLGTAEMAGHQVAINIASLTFMVPLGISAAAAVLVGQAVGRGDPVEARYAAGSALACGTIFMTVSAIVLLGFPGALARFYTTDGGVIAVALALIPLAGVFQIFDGLQVVAGGVLRGLGDTRVPMVASLIGYWMIGLPISLYLGFRTGAGPAGLWWGLVAGLAAVAFFLVARVRARLRRTMARVIIDDEAGDARALAKAR